jgi:YD repeat-containing protein
VAFPGPRQVPRRCSRSRDAVGNRLQVNELVPNALGTPGQTTSVQNTYGYDRLYRLTNVNSPSTPTYTYDPIGNRLTNPTTSYSYDRADRITAAGSTPYTVDAAGNLTARGSDSFSYDQANRLKTATVEGQLTTYAYDGDGNRVSKTVGSNPTVSYVNEVTTPLSQVLTDGTLKYVYGLGHVYALDRCNNVQVYHADGLGLFPAVTEGVAHGYMAIGIAGVSPSRGNSGGPEARAPRSDRRFCATPDHRRFGQRRPDQVV